MEAVRSWARAVAVGDGTIAYVGSETGVARFVGQDTASPFLPDERIDLGAALAAFMINAAYVNGIEDRTGSIETG
jgi:predicted amidohydrolase YtcJ